MSKIAKNGVFSIAVTWPAQNVWMAPEYCTAEEDGPPTPVISGDVFSFGATITVFVSHITVLHIDSHLPIPRSFGLGKILFIREPLHSS